MTIFKKTKNNSIFLKNFNDLINRFKDSVIFKIYKKDI